MHLIGLIVVFLIILISFSCSATNLPLVNIGNKQVYLHNSTLNWYEASQFCVLHQLRLLTIYTSLENFFIGEFIKSNQVVGFIWTSGTDLANEGEWIWMSSGSPFKFNGFFPPKPDNYNHKNACISENCLAIGFITRQQCLYWEDVQCYDKYQFICEKVLDAV